MIHTYTVSRDDTLYEAFPDVALTRSGKMICVFAECVHHADRSYTRIMLTESNDRGRTWAQKRPLTDPTRGYPFWNCPRISCLRDGRIAVVVDKLFPPRKAPRPITAGTIYSLAKTKALPGRPLLKRLPLASFLTNSWN